MLSINDLQNGSMIKIDGQPFVVLSVKNLHIGRGGSSIQTKIKNVKTGQVLERNYKPADAFEETEIEKMKSRFLYESRGTYWFDEVNNSPRSPMATGALAKGLGAKNRFSLKADEIGDQAQFLKPNLEILAIQFDGKIISIELPIKVDYKVIEAPPAVRGDTAQGGTKIIVIEGGAKISTPLFINEGDVIRINTSTGEYT